MRRFSRAAPPQRRRLRAARACLGRQRQEPGEGIESTGEIAALALHRRGYHIFGFRHFASRIKGGHTHYRLRIGTERVLTPGDQMDVLIALDQESVDHNLPDLAAGAVLIHDDSFAPELPDGHGLQFHGTDVPYGP